MIGSFPASTMTARASALRELLLSEPGLEGPRCGPARCLGNWWGGRGGGRTKNSRAAGRRSGWGRSGQAGRRRARCRRPARRRATQTFEIRNKRGEVGVAYLQRSHASRLHLFIRILHQRAELLGLKAIGDMRERRSRSARSPDAVAADAAMRSEDRFARAVGRADHIPRR